jgi:hypothetical protein
MHTLLQHSYSEDHDCSFEDIIFVSCCKVTLEDKIKELMTANYRMQIILAQKDLFESQFRKENLAPTFVPSIPKIKWKAGIRMDEVTPEMRKEREDWIVANKGIGESNAKLMGDWYAAMREATDKFLMENFAVVEEELDYIHGYSAHRDCQLTYSIGEVEEI